MSADRFSVNGTGPIKKGKPSPPEPNRQADDPSLVVEINTEYIPGYLPERNRRADEILAERCDGLGQLWAVAEKKLKALKPPHPVWTQYGRRPLGNPEEAGPDCWELLGLTKIKGKWRLCHGTGNSEGDDMIFDVQPIVECPREVRIEAAPCLHQLHLAIIRAKEEYILNADEAIAELTEAISQL